MFVNELHQGGVRALLAWEPTLFDNMQLPTGVQLDDVVDNILYKYGDTPLYTPDPAVVKFYIGRWSKRRLPVWNKYKALLAIDFNPLENYDRTELTTKTNTGTQTLDREGDDTVTRSGEDKLTRSGDDTTARNGEDKLARTGDDTTTRNGEDKLARTGDDTVTRNGEDELAKTGDDTTTRNGEDKLTKSGSEKSERDITLTKDVAAFNSSSYSPALQDTTDDDTELTFTNRDDTRTYTDLEDKTDYNSTETRTYTDLEDKTAYNSTDTRTFTNLEDKTDYNSTDTRTYTNLEDKTTYNSTDTRTYTNLKDKTDYNSSNTRTDDLTEEIDSHIHGNIGVTSSQDMFKQQIDIIPYYDLIDFITTDWHQEFNLYIY